MNYLRWAVFYEGDNRRLAPPLTNTPLKIGLRWAVFYEGPSKSCNCKENPVIICSDLFLPKGSYLYSIEQEGRYD